MNTARQILVRFLSLAAVVAGAWLLSSLDDASVGANIGAGLAALGGLGLAALTWGVIDGRRDGFVRTTLRWCVLAAIAGLALATFVLVQDGDYSAAAFGAAASLWVYLGVLIAVSALIGAAVAQLGRRRPGPENSGDPAGS